jgi:hypothetical protein
MNLVKFVEENKQIVAAVLAGIFAITAAYIRRDRRHEKAGGDRPFRRLMLPPLLCLVLGAGLLAAENYAYNFDPAGEWVSVHNPGAGLALGGCIFLAAGVIWGFIHFIRLLTLPRRKEQPEGSVLLAPSSSTTVIKPAAKAVDGVKKSKS